MAGIWTSTTVDDFLPAGAIISFREEWMDGRVMHERGKESWSGETT